MAFPPPFNNPMMAPRIPPNNQPGQFAGQKFGFFSPQTNVPPIPPQVMQMPQMPMVGGIQLTLRPNFRPFMKKPAEAQPPVQFVTPIKPIAVTTVFIGNITDKCHDSVVQEILGKCGTIHSWKRLQDPNGKFKAFGFCEFSHPDGTRRALRVLKDYPLGDKRLNVKVDDATEKYLKEFAENQTKLLGLDSGTKSVNQEEDDRQLRAAFKAIIEKNAPEMLNMVPEVEAGTTAEDSTQKDGNKTPGDNETSKVHKRKHVSKSPSSKKHGKRSSSKIKHSKRSGSHSKRSKRSSSSSSSSSSTSSSTNTTSAYSPLNNNKKRRNNKESTPSSEDSCVIAEKKRIKKELAEREESYLLRLKKWEDREKRMAKQYIKDKESEIQRQKTIEKEAKKLRQFLEDYVDERDDVKYYKGSALFERRRNYERERDADAKDRHEEKREMEEVKKQLLKEKEIEQQRLQEELAKKEKETILVKEIWETVPGKPQSNGVAEKGKEVYPDDHPKPMPPSSEEQLGEEISSASPSPIKKPIITTIQQKTIQQINGVFEEDEEEEEDTLHQIKKKIKPFEITREDRIHSLTPEERKKLIKDLINRIPTDRELLFAFSISWEFLDEQLMDQRVRPWINKKICEYIGEEEPSLVSFICEKITTRTSPNNILADLAMVLDDEAEVFTVKLWRLIVYESEAKRLGLNVLPNNKSSN